MYSSYFKGMRLDLNYNLGMRQEMFKKVFDFTRTNLNLIFDDKKIIIA
jgi:hypothetical protein